jgi:chorismate mutase
MMATPLVRAVRGAITCSADTPEEITVATQELLTAMMERNELAHDDVISVIFTTTGDLTSAFPATCARGIGFGDIPLLCASEINVPGSMARCIRILLHAYTARTRTEVRHVYLRGAQSLRDDLPG